MQCSPSIVTCAAPRLLWFDRVLADVGDGQSLQQSLSTFSGHVRRLRLILAAVTPASLALLDEVGSGTVRVPQYWMPPAFRACCLRIVMASPSQRPPASDTPGPANCFRCVLGRHEVITSVDKCCCSNPKHRYARSEAARLI